MVLIYKKGVYPIVVACLVSPNDIHVSVVNFHLHCEVPLLREFKAYLPGTQGLCAEFYTPLVLQTTANTEHAFSEVGNTLLQLAYLQEKSLLSGMSFPGCFYFVKMFFQSISHSK